MRNVPTESISIVGGIARNVNTGEVIEYNIFSLFITQEETMKIACYLRTRLRKAAGVTQFNSIGVG